MTPSAPPEPAPPAAPAAPAASAAEPLSERRLLLGALALALVGGVALVALAGGGEASGPGGGTGPVLPRVPGPAMGGGGASLLRTLGLGSLAWYAALVAAPFFVLLARRSSSRGVVRLAWAALEVAAVLLLAVAAAWLQYRLAFAAATTRPPFVGFLRVTGVGSGVPFVAVAAMAHALVAGARLRERELRAARAESLLAEARLELLTAQLQPHFLFNTLQGIGGLVRSDPDGADRMLADLADLLREVLRRGDRHEVPLSEELRVLEPYLALARRRFGARLALEVDVPPETLDHPVPFFVLQPLVENALDHGIGRSAAGGTVTVTSRSRDGGLVLSVVDDGPGGPSPSRGEGIGLSNLRARLARLHGSRARLEAGRRAEGGFEARVILP